MIFGLGFSSFFRMHELWRRSRGMHPGGGGSGGETVGSETLERWNLKLEFLPIKE